MGKLYRLHPFTLFHDLYKLCSLYLIPKVLGALVAGKCFIVILCDCMGQQELTMWAQKIADSFIFALS